MMSATHTAAAVAGMSVFVIVALASQYPLLKLALVAAAGTATAYAIVSVRAVLS